MIEEFILTSGDDYSPAVFRYGNDKGIVIRDHDGAQSVYLKIEDMESLMDWWEREKRIGK